MLTGVAATIIVGVSALIIGSVILHPSLAMLAIACISVTLVYLATVWAFGLSEFERKLFESYLPLALRRITA
jgi:membrane protein EpsK